MIGTFIYNLFITPLEYIFEVVFSLINRITEMPAIAIIGLSLVMNFLVLPLYKRADTIQEEERDKVASMSQWVNHIKKTFKGDERYMMLNTYYRQQNYKPIYALRSSFSLILQIPFFIAAYHFLSNLPILEGESFLFLNNLGAPDQLLHIGSITINIMPIIMTLINFISGYIYLRGFPLKDKIQTYGIGIIFLILLYNSPSGLVFYWTLNQVFSMLKNVFMKLVKSRKVLNFIFSIAGAVIVILAFILVDMRSFKRVALIIVLFLICQIPLIISFVRKRVSGKSAKLVKESKYQTFLAGGIFMSIFAGVIIPLSVIGASPTEFVTNETTPSSLILSTLATCIGYFVVWFGIFYYLANKKGRLIFSYIIWLISGIAVVDFLFFSRSMGTMSIYLIFDNEPQFPSKATFINLIIVVALMIIMLLFMYFFDRFVPYIYLALIIGAIALSAINGIKVQNKLKSTEFESTISHDREKIIPLSTKGKNVIIFMLDKAVSAYLPYIFQEKPELKEAFSGFTFYPNTVSFGAHTNFTSPQLFGGYEYRPLQINERNDEWLVDKQNESLKVLPKLFSDNGYTVTVCDPPYAGYKMISDLSVFDDLDGVRAYHTMGKYQRTEDISKYGAETKKMLTRNFFFYSIFKSVPVFLQNTVYDRGNYCSATDKFQGLELFMNAYSVLESLPEITEVLETEQNTFLMIDNDTAHEPVFLEWPDYTPTQDKEVPHIADSSTYVIDGKQLPLETTTQIQHYDVNMATYLQVSAWLQFLKDNGVYDNTRIIFVADHAATLGQIPGLFFEGFDLGRVNPLLLVKDFNSTEYAVSDEFMTNADVPTMATQDLINNPINPYTGNPINNEAKYKEKIIITTSSKWDTEINNGKTFDTSDGPWLEVHDNIFDLSNWSVVTP